MSCDNTYSSSVFSKSFAGDYSVADIENVFAEKDAFRITITDEEMNLLQSVFENSHSYTFESHSDYMKFMNKQCHNRFSKTKLLKAYRILINENKIERNYNLEKFMKLKNSKGNSGILQITTMMSGQLFGDEKFIKNGGCPHKCVYCCLEVVDGVVTQPKSYRTLEPANQRATQNKHHPVGQIFDRLNVFEKMGHLSPEPGMPAKIEYMMSGGTFNFFPEDYIIWFTTMSYYAMNVYYDYTMTGKLREPLSLEEEQKINETAPIRMIGLTIETRPDYLTTKDDIYKVVRFFRRLGVTRVQPGVQHTDDEILKKVKRDCTNKQNEEGNKILMQNGFKVDNHWMLDLPFSSPEKDLEMVKQIFVNPNYAVDQTKLYPTTVIEYSELYDMYQNGDYKPYSEEENGKIVQNIIEEYLIRVPYYMRVNRVVRDFYSDVVVSGLTGDMRKVAEDSVEAKGMILKDIRHREVGDASFDENDNHMFIEKYEACDGTNYFISFENKNRTKLYGFVRLRFNISTTYVMPELMDCALIRELHVYGNHTAVGDKQKSTQKSTQHRGLGKKLIQKAEEIASLNGYEKIVVISGVGVRDYYRKLGYYDYHTYLAKDIEYPLRYHVFTFVMALMFMFVTFYLFIS